MRRWRVTTARNGVPGVWSAPIRKRRAGITAHLKLHTDRVVLSACDTASADGSPGADGPSGLAKAFFRAGARSPFFSHGQLVSRALIKLTSAMFRELAENP